MNIKNIRPVLSVLLLVLGIECRALYVLSLEYWPGNLIPVQVKNRFLDMSLTYGSTQVKERKDMWSH
jgi:hypothetical protein